MMRNPVTVMTDRRLVLDVEMIYQILDLDMEKNLVTALVEQSLVQDWINLLMAWVD